MITAHNRAWRAHVLDDKDGNDVAQCSAKPGKRIGQGRRIRCDWLLIRSLVSVGGLDAWDKRLVFLSLVA